MAWNIDDISRDELKADKRQDFNKRQKAFAKTLGENTASLGCILIIVMFVGYIWTDMKIQLEWERILCDAAASIISFILVEDLMSQNGVRCGMLYDEYVKAHEAYLELKAKVLAAGISKLGDFCEAIIEKEYETYIRRKCKEFKLDYETYVNRFSSMRADELNRELSPDKVAHVLFLNAVKRIELTPDMLLTDGSGEKVERGGIGMGAHEYVKKSTRGWFNITITVVSCAVSASIAFFGNAGASWGLVMYTLMKLALLFWRMYKGFSTGTKAFNTYEVKSLQDKMLYMNMYLESLTDSSVTLPEFIDAK